MKEMVVWGNEKVELTWLTDIEFFKTKSKAVTSCFIIPKEASSQSILMTKNGRGLDFIGGHVENNETPFEALQREALEEAGVKINKSKFIGAIHVFNPNWTKESKYPKSAYQLFYLSNELNGFDLEDFNGVDYECTERRFVDLSEVEKEHHNLLQVHKEMLKNIN